MQQQWDLNPWPWDDEACVLPVNHWQLSFWIFFLHCSPVPLQMPVAKLKPLTLSWWGKCSTLFLASPSTWLPEAAARLKPLTLGWWGKCFASLMRGHLGYISISLPSAAVGLEPLSLGWWGMCSTTYCWWLSWLNIFFLPFSLISLPTAATRLKPLTLGW